MWFVLCHIRDATCQVSGKLIAGNGQPIPFATVLLLKSGDTALVKATLTKENGTYRIDSVPPGSYILRFSSAGYESLDSLLFEISALDKSKDLGTLVMKEEPRQLQDVVVRAGKPLYQQRPEGITVNVEGSILTKGSSALEVLERSPGVAINHQDNSIALNGKSGVQVMLDGKPMRMSMEQVVALLNGMSANEIATIELLTTPSAGYDAEGSAGLINIVLKKNKKRGTHGAASITGGVGWGEKGGATVNIAHNTARTGIYGSYTFAHDRSYNYLSGEGYQDFPRLGGKMNVGFWSTTKPVQDVHNLKIGIDTKLNPKAIIGGSISYDRQHTVSVAVNRSEYRILPDSLLIFNGEIDGASRWDNLATAMYLEKELGHGGKINVDLDYLYYHNDNNAYVQSNFTNSDGVLAGANDSLYSPYQKSFARTAIQIAVVKMDYSKQLSKKLKLEAGVKGTFTRDPNVSGIEKWLNNGWVASAETSNDRVMKEGIGAGYASLHAQIDSSTNLVMGARYEYSHTRLDDANNKANSIIRRQGTFFPDVFLTRKLTDHSNIQLSYTKRINRPTYNDLASYVGYSDPVAVYSGNPLLRSTITHNLKLGTTYHGYVFSLLLSRDLYPIARYQLTTNSSHNLLYISPQNLVYEDKMILQAYLPFKMTSWWDMSYSFAGGPGKFKVDYTLYPAEKAYFGYTVNGSQAFRLPGRLSVEISGWYHAVSYEGRRKQMDMDR